MLQSDPIALVTGKASPELPAGELSQSLRAQDSINRAVKDSLANMNLNDIKDVVTGQNTLLRDALGEGLNMLIGFVPKLLGCIFILWIGFKLIKLVKKSFLRILEKRNAETSIKTFLASLVDVLLKIMVIIMAMDVIGIKATSFIAILGALGLAVGMALQGTLQNFAGGVIILLLKNFRVGDYIECGSYKGYVREIKIFNTTIQPFNGRTIIVPNSELSNKSIINHTKEPVIRLDVEASVAYGTDLDFARQVLQQVVDEEKLILHEPKAPTIAVKDLGASSVDFAVWMWVKVEDYWTVWMRIRENIYKAFYANNIAIPFPQVDVHLDKIETNNTNK